MSRLLSVLFLSIFLVGCEALWEDDVTELPTPESAPVAVTAPATSESASASASVNEPDKVVVTESAPVAAEASGPKFSWEAPAAPASTVIAPTLEAPKDPAKARITEIRESLGLVAFVRSEAPAVKSLLQLSKEGKVLVVEVASVKGTQVVANILPGQKNAAQLSESDTVGVTSFGVAGK